MVDYPTDLDLDTNFDTHLDDTNDLALTSGVSQLEQSVSIDAGDEIVEFISGKVTGENVGYLEEAIKSGFNEDPQLESVYDVSVREYNRDTGVITVTARVIGDDNFTIELTE